MKRSIRKFSELARKFCSKKIGSITVVIFLLGLRVLTVVSADPSALVTKAPTGDQRSYYKNRSKLLKPDKRRLIEAQVNNQKEFTLLVAAMPGSNESLVRSVVNFGGRVQYRDDDVSYLRVKLPTEKVVAFSSSPVIEAVSADGPVAYTSDEAGMTGPEGHVASPSADTPAENPYLPTTYIGAPQFIAAHPTFDGRGVTIGIVDTTIDLLIPELQTAKSLDGKTRKKIIDVVNAAASAIDPSDDLANAPGYFVIKTQEQQTDGDNRLSVDGDLYVAPAPGRYRIGTLNERTTGSQGDLNRDGNPPGSSGLFAVLWNETTNSVWIDTNQDHSFADQNPMTDYRIRQDIGIFGKDDPATPVRESIGFTIQTDISRKLLIVNPADGIHGTAVAGLAAGNHFFGGRMSGAAPEAQIVSVPFVYTQNGISHSLLESIIVAVKHPLVDLVNVSAGVVRVLNDGTSVHSVICDRLIEKFKKPIFTSAGNSGDEVNIVQELAAGNNVIAVGSYLNRETSRVNYGVATIREDNVDRLSSRGPSKNGAFKPNLLAPSASLTTKPRHLSGEPIKNTYPLPPGYLVSSGTSAAAPIAAGAVALIISAAKQSSVGYNADSLRWAIMSSARYLPEIGAYEQGAGLLQVDAVWKALKSAPLLPEISSLAPIKYNFSDQLNEPNQGLGIYEREGWVEGQVGKRTITFLRSSGDRQPVTYKLHWLGGENTFSSPTTLTLPLGKPASLVITIRPRKSGVHSAILNLEDPAAGHVVHQTMNTVVAAERFTPRNHFRITHDARLKWLESRSFYLNVPAGVAALSLDVRIHGNLRPWVMSPSGYHYYVRASSVPFSNFQTNGSWSRIVPNPEAGVWQVIIENNNIPSDPAFSAQREAAFTFNASILGVDVEPKVVSITSTEFVLAREVSFTNRFAEFVGGVGSVSLASSYSEDQTASTNMTPVIHQITVPPGASSLSAGITVNEKNDADLDLYIFDCTAKQCVLKDVAAREGPSEFITIESPAAGTWKVVVDGFRLQPRLTRYQYQDVLTHSDFGSVTSTKSPSSHASGSRWIEPVRLQIGKPPGARRRLVGLIVLRTMLIPDKSDDGGVEAKPNPYYKQAILGSSMIRIESPPWKPKH